jgi:hypothetical protein
MSSLVLLPLPRLLRGFAFVDELVDVFMLWSSGDESALDTSHDPFFSFLEAVACADRRGLPGPAGREGRLIESHWFPSSWILCSAQQAASATASATRSWARRTLKVEMSEHHSCTILSSPFLVAFARFGLLLVSAG